MSDYSKRKIEITCWRSGRVLFAHEAENNTMRLTVEAAVKAGANLDGADLAGVNLAWADLTGANLDGADLRGADLDGADLTGADGEKITLVGSRPILQIGPIGSEWGTLITYLTDRGIYLSLGCFFGTREQFAARLADTHHDNIHASEYAAALALVDAHAELWTPTETEEDAA